MYLYEFLAIYLSVSSMFAFSHIKIRVIRAGLFSKVFYLYTTFTPYTVGDLIAVFAISAEGFLQNSLAVLEVKQLVLAR